MDIEIRGSVVTGAYDLVLKRPWHNSWVISSLTEHDLRDLVFVLERRTAGGQCCPETDGEHTCANAPGHAEPHLCRGCTRTWRLA